MPDALILSPYGGYMRRILAARNHMKYFRYRNTNCFFIKSKHNDSYLAIDAGWP